MELTLIAKEQLGDDVTSFVFDCPEQFRWKAGQYMHVTLPHPNPDDRGVERWFTIAAPPFENRPRITTHILPAGASSFKQALVRLAIGSRLHVDPPEGEFTMGPLDEAYIFIAGGIGFTPYHAMLMQLDHESRMPALQILYASKQERPTYLTELEKLAQKYPQLKLHIVQEPERLDQTLFRRYLPDPIGPQVYIYGPEPMVESLETLLLDYGVPDGHLKRDYFPGYTWKL